MFLKIKVERSTILIPVKGNKVEDHYTRSNLSDIILLELQKAGRDINALTPEDLSPVDEFHIRGREATKELANLADLKRDSYVLDVGCGIGGPSRYLASEFGCYVTGIDLTEEYCKVAKMLAQRTGLKDRVNYEYGDALQMPFDDGIFDIVWMQHTTMNIEAKLKLYSEIYRVLKLGGRLALYEICSGGGGSVYFPVPWAHEPSISFLVSAEQMRYDLKNTGFRVLTWRDATHPALEWFLEMLERQKVDRSPLGLNVLIGPEWGTMVANLIKNLKENRIALVQGVLDRRN